MHKKSPLEAPNKTPAVTENKLGMSETRLRQLEKARAVKAALAAERKRKTSVKEPQRKAVTEVAQPEPEPEQERPEEPDDAVIFV